MNNVSSLQKSNYKKFNLYLCFSLLIILLVSTGHFSQANAQAQTDIKLVLQITVDGLRGDLLDRYGKNFGQKGFRYLLNNGTVYTNAHYQHANTETIVGHATLATGAFPSDHGMIGNVWYDREAGELAYNIEDPDAPIIPTREAVSTGEQEQVDPAKKHSRSQGRSPSVLLAPTFGDTLMTFYGNRSKSFGVSGKDRSAVAMAGHTGKAFWYSTDTGDFVTSRYYYDDYPEWAKQWNELRKAETYSEKSWDLLNDPSTYLLKDQDNREYETDLKGYGRVFPHRYAPADDKLLYLQLLFSPFGDSLLLDFSKALIKGEKIGQDEYTDYLSISFSGVDAINHFFGVSSLENEDTVLQLDKTLADLFRFIDDQVGLDQTLIVLSADHGMAEMPEYMTELGLKVGRLYSEDVVSIANTLGKDLFSIDDMVKFFYRPYLYLDENKIRAADLDIAVVEKRLAAALTDVKGIALAAPRDGLPMIQAPAILKQIQNNYHPSRSGDIYIAQEPYWFMFEKGPAVAMHGSPWNYDTHVPVIFSGPGITAQTIARLIHPVDVAPTLSAYLGMSPPAASSGTGLHEILEQPGSP